MPLDGAEQRKLCKAVGEFGGYLRTNAASIPNYGERHRAGEVISSSLAESTINQVGQQTDGEETADAVDAARTPPPLQVRTRVLNDDFADDFRRWHPGFTRTTDPEALAA